jgi:predicted MPP superfamily phosphohydrolase
MGVGVAEIEIAQQQKISRRKFLLRAPLIAAGGFAFYSAEIARHEISVERHDLRIDGLSHVFDGFRIAQISDIHFDEYTEPSFVRRVVEHINSLQPDLVLLTGDYISMGPLSKRFARHALEHCAEILHGLNCPQRFAAMGNHDQFLGDAVIGQALAGAGIPLLVNEHRPIERNGEHFWLSAIQDPVTHEPNLEATIPQKPDAPVLLMAHGPDYADALLAHPRGTLVSAMFSGHTHGGQVRIPFMPPMHLPEGGQKYVEGAFQLGRLQLYVNRGIGAVGVPFRLNCPPEVTLFTLRSA